MNKGSFIRLDNSKIKVINKININFLNFVPGYGELSNWLISTRKFFKQTYKWHNCIILPIFLPLRYHILKYNRCVCCAVLHYINLKGYVEIE